MVTALLVLHVLVSFLLIFIVLVQGGKGAELGAAFGGGSSNTLFGSRGAATFLGKMTTVVAVIFFVTSLMLAYTSFRGASVMKQTIPAADRSPAAPGPGAQGIPEGGQIPATEGQPLTPAEDTTGGGSPATGEIPAQETPAGQQ